MLQGMECKTYMSHCRQFSFLCFMLCVYVCVYINRNVERNTFLLCMRVTYLRILKQYCISLLPLIHVPVLILEMFLHVHSYRKNHMGKGILLNHQLCGNEYCGAQQIVYQTDK